MTRKGESYAFLSLPFDEPVQVKLVTIETLEYPSRERQHHDFVSSLTTFPLSLQLFDELKRQEKKHVIITPYET